MFSKCVFSDRLLISTLNDSIYKWDSFRFKTQNGIVLVVRESTLKSLTCNFQPVFVFYSFKCTEQCCSYQNSKSNTTTSTSVYSFDSPENSHRSSHARYRITSIKTHHTAKWLWHNMIHTQSNSQERKDPHCIGYQYWLGLSSENSDSERRE